MVVISKKLLEVLGEDKDLGNLLHTHYVYDCDKEDQIIAKAKISALLKHYCDERFLDLAFDDNSRALIAELIALKNEPDWNEIIKKLLDGLLHLLERELKEAEELRKPAKIKEQIVRELAKVHIFQKDDKIDITEKNGIVTVHYLSMQHSPEYNPEKKSYYGQFEPWRDTEMIFELNFNKNLFIWKYINVHKPFQGRKIGSALIQFAENLGKNLGFERFTVEYPNREFWAKIGYKVPERCDVGVGYSHEAYRSV